MTRKDKLIAMNGQTLIQVADKLGVKVKCNKTRTALKESKAAVIDRIIEAEGPEEPDDHIDLSRKPKTTKEFLEAVNDVLDGRRTAPRAPKSSIKAPEDKAEAKTPKKPSAGLKELTYKGKTKTIKEWAAEIDMPWPTLYDRVNRNGWPVDLAIETPLGKRRPKA